MLRVLPKIPVVLAAVLAVAAMSGAPPCAALPQEGSFLDRAGLVAGPGADRGAFSRAGSFASGAARGAVFTALQAAPAAGPESATMLLAGLALLVLVARRRWRALRAAE